METSQERNQRIQRLETQRAERRGQGGGYNVWPTPDDAGTGVIPVEIAPGRGDLNYPVAGFVPTFPTALGLIGGRAVSFARIFQSQPRVAAAVMRLMQASIRVPLKVYRKTGEENAAIRLRPGDHPLADAIQTPWERGSQAGLTMAMIGSVLVHGNAVIRAQSGRSEAIQFQPKDWRFTRPIMPFRDSIAGYDFNVDSTYYVERDVSVDEVIHVAWWSPVSPIGTSPLMQLGVTLNIEDAAQRYQASLFLHGGRPPSKITMTDIFADLPYRERQQLMGQLRADIQTIYGNPEGSARPALLPPGLDWVPLAHQTAVEAALIEQRTVAEDEIYAVYQVPKIPEKATPQTMDVLRQMLYSDAVGPLLVLAEQAINAQLVWTQIGDPEIYVEYDMGGVLRGDRLAEIDALRGAISMAMMTPNEARDALAMPRSDLPEMSQFLAPFNNLWPINSPPLPGQRPPGTPGGPPSQDAEPSPAQSHRLHVRSRDRDYDLDLARA